MANVKWRVKVMNTKKGLSGYKEASLSSKKMETSKNNTIMYVDKIANNSEGIWLRNVDTRYWYRQMTPSGTVYLNHIEDVTPEDIENTTRTIQYYQDKYKVYNTSRKIVEKETMNSKKTTTQGIVPTYNTSGKVKKTTSTAGKSKSNITAKKGNMTDVVQVNSKSYPAVSHTDNSGTIWYDWTMNTSSLAKKIKTIKKNLNATSAYTRPQLAKLTNTKFNKLKLEFGDYRLKPTRAYVVFTRPDLNLFDEDGEILSQISNDPQMYYIWRNNPAILKQLSLKYSTSHKFIPLLTNQVIALDILDETVDTFETGQTWAGFKLQYAKTNIRSLTAGSISVKFPETENFDITHMFQAWCSYENGVYRGTLMPKEDYCAYKILDYACDIYYFLTDADYNIKFWSVYLGAFPTNVNKSIFSFDMGSDSGLAEANISFSYFHKLDLDIRSLVDFNSISGGVVDGEEYLADYNPDIVLGTGGSTWCGAPFIEAQRVNNGLGKVDQFKLRFRPK